MLTEGVFDKAIAWIHQLNTKDAKLIFMQKSGDVIMFSISGGTFTAYRRSDSAAATKLTVLGTGNVNTDLNKMIYSFASNGYVIVKAVPSMVANAKKFAKSMAVAGGAVGAGYVIGTTLALVWAAFMADPTEIWGNSIIDAIRDAGINVADTISNSVSAADRIISTAGYQQAINQMVGVQ
jgi:hypothetical protein